MGFSSLSTAVLLKSPTSEVFDSQLYCLEWAQDITYFKNHILHTWKFLNIFADEWEFDDLIWIKIRKWGRTKNLFGNGSRVSGSFNHRAATLKEFILIDGGPWSSFKFSYTLLAKKTSRNQRCYAERIFISSIKDWHQKSKELLNHFMIKVRLLVIFKMLYVLSEIWFSTGQYESFQLSSLIQIDSFEWVHPETGNMVPRSFEWL